VKCATAINPRAHGLPPSRPQLHERHFATRPLGIASRPLDTVALSLHSATSTTPPLGHSTSPKHPTRIAQRSATQNTTRRTATIRNIFPRHETRHQETASDLCTYTARHNIPHRTAIFHLVPRAVQTSPPKDDTPTSFPQPCWRAAKCHLRTGHH
jgi:hypothetical protein